MSDKSELLVTIVFGNRSTSVSLSDQDPQALKLLQSKIAAKFDVDPKFQRLVFRGRNVEMSTVLTNGCKLLLLRNRAFYEQAAAVKPVETSETLSLSAPSLNSAENVASKIVSRTLEVNVNELDDDVLVIQVFRGKSRFDGIYPCSGSILDVKVKLSAVLGLTSPQALKLVVKGKTPADTMILKTLVGGKKTMKAMALLQEQQHATKEKEEDLRELLNELVGAQATLQRLQKQMKRNFMSRDESLLQLSRVLDDGQRIAGNLELVKQHLEKPNAAGLLASKETLVAIVQAMKEAQALAETAQRLLENHSLV